MKNRLISAGRCLFPGAVLFSLIFVRFLYYGFQYFYQLDDYIQYHNYAYFNEGLWQLVCEMGMLQSRPAAGFFDVFFWSKLFPVMIVGVALISLMYTAAVLLFKKVWSRHFDAGWIFAVVLALLPLGIEGIYWVSASSRIVCGLFFCAVGAYLLQRFFDGDKWYTVAAAFILQLFGGCFYEQILVLSVVLFMILGALSFRKDRLRTLWALLSVAVIALYFVFTSLMPEGVIYSGRMEIILPNTPWYYDVFLPDILRQFRLAFLDGGFYTLVKGFVRGTEIMVDDKAVAFSAVIIVLCVCLWYIASRKTEDRDAHNGRKPRWIGVAAGVVLAIAPVTPFLVISNPWFSLRGTVCSFVGIALVCDLVLTGLLKLVKCPAKVSAAIASVMAFVFCVAAVSEIHDYKLTTENDQKVGAAIIESVDLSDPDHRIGLLGVEPSALEDQNFFFHEHIHGVTESGWAITGLVQYMTKNRHLPQIVPLPSDSVYKTWNYESNRIDGFDRVYYYDGDGFIPLAVKRAGEREFELYLENGTYFGRVWDDNGIGRLTVGESN